MCFIEVIRPVRVQGERRIICLPRSNYLDNLTLWEKLSEDIWSHLCPKGNPHPYECLVSRPDEWSEIFSLQFSLQNKTEELHKMRLNTCRLIYRAYCQARTSSQYNIDGGYEDIKLKTYQQKRELWALKETCDWKKFWDIIYFIKMYDLVYNMTFNALKLTKKSGNRF